MIPDVDYVLEREHAYPLRSDRYRETPMQSAFSRVVVTFVILGLSGTGNVAISQVGLTSDVRVGWLKKNAVSVRTIDPRDQEFSDLMALKRSIGNARIVMLGESKIGRAHV